MVSKTYSVSLDDKEVERAKNNYAKYGTKLSPLLNHLLKQWNDEEEKKECP